MPLPCVEVALTAASDFRLAAVTSITAAVAARFVERTKGKNAKRSNGREGDGVGVLTKQWV